MVGQRGGEYGGMQHSMSGGESGGMNHFGGSRSKSRRGSKGKGKGKSGKGKSGKGKKSGGGVISTAAVPFGLLALQRFFKGSKKTKKGVRKFGKSFKRTFRRRK